MAARVVILGAGFAGLELSTLSEALGEQALVTLINRGVCEQYEITLGCRCQAGCRRHRTPSRALLAAFAEPGIRFLPNRRGRAVDARRRVATLDDGSELAWELFLGVPKRRAPTSGTPKACVFAEGAAKAVASALIDGIRGEASLFAGAGSCYIEFGGGRIGRVDVDFFSGPKPTGTYHEPDVASRVHKEEFGASRKARWFGM